MERPEISHTDAALNVSTGLTGSRLFGIPNQHKVVNTERDNCSAHKARKF